MPAGPTYEPIATTTLGSPTSTITFSSIANTWTDLRLVLVGNITAAQSTQLQVNGSTSTLYSQTTLYGDGSSAQSYRVTDSSYIELRSTWPNSQPFMITCDFMNYAGSTFKTMLLTHANDRNGSGIVERHVGLWRGTAAITSVALTASGTTWTTGTTVALYGIARA